MSSIWKRKFWTDAIERAAKTAAQVLLTMLTAAQTNLLDIDWQTGLATAGLAAAASILTSGASSQTGTVGTASLVAAGATTDPSDKDSAERDKAPVG